MTTQKVDENTKESKEGKKENDKMDNEEMNEEELTLRRRRIKKRVGKCPQQLTPLARALWFCPYILNL